MGWISARNNLKETFDKKEITDKDLEEIKNGHQVYVVAPLIEDDENDSDSVVALKEKFEKIKDEYNKKDDNFNIKGGYICI